MISRLAHATPRRRSVGRSGTLELSADVWKFLGQSARSQAAQIQADEKLLVQPSFRAPMLAKIPYPPWALKKEDVDTLSADGEPIGELPAAIGPKKSALPLIGAKHGEFRAFRLDRLG